MVNPVNPWTIFDVVFLLFKGQSVPAGLHIRMNLETGLREAKLMDGDDGEWLKQGNKSYHHPYNTSYCNYWPMRHLIFLIYS